MRPSFLWKGFICLIDKSHYENYKSLSPQSTFPIKLYRPEENPTMGQILEKDVQCFLGGAVSTLNSQREIF